MVLDISYDLRKPGRDYSSLYETIKSLGAWCHPLESTWYVDTALSVEQVAKAIESVVDPSDAFLISTVALPASQSNLHPDAVAWLSSHLKPVSSLAFRR